MAELKKGKSFVTLTGKVKITENTFRGEQTSPTTGYKYSRISLGVETGEGSLIFAEMMGGYQPTKPVINAMDKEGQQLYINWSDRLIEGVVESVADFKIHKIGLTRDEQGQLVIKKFLSPIDVENYLKEHLKDGMEVTVRGSYSFNEYKGETQRKIQIQNIFLPYQQKDKETNQLLPVQYGATFTQTVLLDEDAFKKITKDEAKEGEVIVKAKAVDYVSKRDGKEVKKNFPFDLPITVKINKENPEMTQKILTALFDVKKGKVRELTIEGTIVEGYEKQEVSNADIQLSDEIKELIAMGLYSEEEAKSKMVVRGNKVSKLVFNRPFIKKTEENPNGIIERDDNKYTADDLIVVIETKEEVELPDLADHGSAPQDDNAWMSALGM